MNKKYFLIGSLAFCQFMAKAQTVPDTSVFKPSKTDIELVYNHYLQNGHNSAVTGGIGTEKLVVYGPAINLKKSKSSHQWLLNTGADIITSASTDNIDFVVSSASKHDARIYVNPGYVQEIPSKKISVKGGLGFSMESDYLSVSALAGFSKESNNKMRSFSAQIQVLNDDLRWGRVNSGYYRPVRLIYPKELRYREWYDQYKRHTYNLKLGLTQIINKRNTAGIFPELTFQNGLLATPFHRIYFKGDIQAVEKLPDKRWKFALALKWNAFLGGRTVLKNTVQFYTDDFGIRSFSYENETAFKINPWISLIPNIRVFTQKGSRFFAGYKEHSINDRYYTSDYDLSTLQTITGGLALKYDPHYRLPKKLWLHSLKLRYQYMNRSNGLTGHIISLVVGMGRE